MAVFLDLAPLYYIIRHYWCPLKRDVPTIDVDARPSRNVMVIKSAASGTEEIPVSDAGVVVQIKFYPRSP